MDTSIQTWASGLKFEKQEMSRADKLYEHFYGQGFKDFNIKRWAYKGEEKKMQQSEVDVTLTYDSTTLNISEKFRTSDYGDMYIELFNNLVPNKKFTIKTNPGWAIKESKADLIYYYTPENIYCVQAKDITKIANELVDDVLVRHRIQNMFENIPTNSVMEFYWKNNNVPVSLIKNYTDKGKSENVTIGISIPWCLLVEMGCKVVCITETKKSNKYKVTNFKLI